MNPLSDLSLLMTQPLDSSFLPKAEPHSGFGEGRFRALVQNSWDILSIIDAQGHLVYNSPAGQRIHGFDTEEFQGRDTFSFIHPDDHSIVGAAFQKVLDHPGLPFTVRYRYAHKGGGWTWMEAVAVNYLDDPEVRGIVTNSREITEQHRAEEAQKRSEALLEQAQALAGIGSFEVDLRRRTTLWSDGMYGFFDRDVSQGAPTWKGLLKLVHPEDQAEFRARIVRSLTQREPLRGRFRVVDAQGQVRHLEVTGRVQADGSGRPERMIGAVQDVTERICTEHALRESLDRFKSLADFLPQSIFEMDLTGKLTFVNRWAYQLFGYSEAEFARGLTNLEMVIPEDRERAVQAAQDTLAGKSSGREYRGLKKDGTTFPMMVHSTPILRDGKAVGLRGLIFDLTELKEAESERDRLKEQLRHSEKMEAIGQLAGGVAHDFNNQLSAIMGFADILLECETDPALHQYAENIAKACERSAELTKQLLAFARRGKYLSVPVDMGILIQEVAQLLQRSLDKRITIEVDLAPNPSMTLGDPSQLQNALMNLALNARDAMPDGGVLAFSDSCVDLDEEQARKLSPGLAPGRYVQVMVADSGTGIPQELLPRIFEPFFTTKERGKGTGLGLASVYGTVQNHRGAISVQTEPGRGSRFTLLLPLLESPAAGATPDASTLRVPAERRVLVVEDEPLVGEMLVGMLQRFGYRADLAMDGVRALEIYREEWSRIDLVILDLVMPKMSGRDTFHAMKAVNPQVRVLLSSGYSVDGEAQQILNQGAFGFLQKPYQSKNLMAALADAFRDS